MIPQATTPATLRRSAGLDILTWPAFGPLAVDVAVTTRHGGVSEGAYASLNLSLQVGDDPARVLENRRRAAAALGAATTDLVICEQVHGRRVAVVGGTDRGRGALRPDDVIAGADGLVTGDPGIVLAVMAADCVPIVLYDPVAHVLGCVHAGWRGTVARVCQSAVDTMASLGARPADIIAGVGPAIAPRAYQVGDDVAAAVHSAFGDGGDGLVRPDGTGRWLFDLWAANSRVLRDAGVLDGNIHLAGIATGAEPGLFFSHRQASPCGRFAALARLRPAAGRRNREQ
jgi:YfiH family protein